jgi:hypothetical protein
MVFCVHPTRPRRTAASRHPALRWRAPARRPPTCEDGIKACGAAWAVPDRIARRTRLAFGHRRTAAAAAVPPARFASGFADHAGSDGVLCSLFVLPRLKAARKQNGAPEASFSRNGMRQRGRRLSRAMLAPTSRRSRSCVHSCLGNCSRLHVSQPRGPSVPTAICQLLIRQRMHIERECPAALCQQPTHAVQQKDVHGLQ